MKRAQRCLAVAALLAGCRSPVWPDEPIAFDYAVACERFLACRTPGGFHVVVAGVGDCIYQNASRADGTIFGDGLFTRISLPCLLAARSCLAVKACEGALVEHDCSGVAVGGATCEGDVLVQCVLGVAQSQDCSLPGFFQDPGGHCLSDGNGGGTCGFAPCDPTVPLPCDGTTMVGCNRGGTRRFDCAPAGALCTEGAMGSTCIGSGAACTADRCDGDALVGCLDGRELRIDCTKGLFHGTCVLDPQFHFPQCVAQPGPDCNPGTYADRCSGATLIYCDGAEQYLDCDALGFAGCATVGGVAHCSE
jgi:hypothetical protein